MAKDEFKTTHNLKFTESPQSPFPGFRAFSVGGFSGYYRLLENDDPRMSVDFMVGVVTVPDHITDVVQWFSVLASEFGCLGVKVLGMGNAALRAVFTQRHGFHPDELAQYFRHPLEQTGTGLRYKADTGPKWKWSAYYDEMLNPSNTAGGWLALIKQATQ